MRIAFHTPFYKNSDFMGHMAEHCVMHPRRNNPLYNAYVVWVMGFLRREMSYFEYYSDMASDDIKHMILTPFSQEVVNYEKIIFQEEFGSIDYVNRVFEKLAQELLDPMRSAKPVDYAFKEITQYHEDCYIHGKYVIFDDTKD